MQDVPDRSECKGGSQKNMLHWLRVHLHLRHRLDCGLTGRSEAQASAGSLGRCFKEVPVLLRGRQTDT